MLLDEILDGDEEVELKLYTAKMIDIDLDMTVSEYVDKNQKVIKYKQV